MEIIKSQVDIPAEISADEAQILLAIKLYEVGKITLGQAAKLAHYTKSDFMETLGRYQVPVYNYPPEDLREEIGL